MPNIKEYTSPIDKLQPTEVGVRAMEGAAIHQAQAAQSASRIREQTGANIGRAIGEVGGAAGAMFEQHQVQTEISKGSALIAGVQDTLSKSWNDAAKNVDPNDGALSDRWREKELGPALEKFQSGFQTHQGQLWAQQQVNHLRQHFFEKTAADTATRAGDAFESNLATFRKGLVNTVNQDPSSLDANLGLIDNTIPVMIDSSKIGAKEGAVAKTKLTDSTKTELVLAGITGVMDKNPDAGLAILRSGKYGQYLSEQQREHLESYAKVHKSSLQHQSDLASAEQRRRETDEVNTNIGNVFTSFVKAAADGSLRVTPEYEASMLQIAKMYPKQHHMVESALSAGRAIADHAAKGIKDADDPAVFESFRKRMFQAPENGGLSIQEVFAAKAAHRLSDSSFQFYTKAVGEEVKNPQIVADQKELDKWFTSQKALITRSTLMESHAWGDQRWGEFQRDVTADFRAARAAGLKIDDLLNPNSQYYLGKKIGQYQLTRDQTVKEFEQRGKGTLSPLPPVQRGVNTVPTERILPPVQVIQDRFNDFSSPAAGPTDWKPGESMTDYAKRIRGGK